MYKVVVDREMNYKRRNMLLVFDTSFTQHGTEDVQGTSLPIFLSSKKMRKKIGTYQPKS
jgi:hypothetical protein